MSASAHDSWKRVEALLNEALDIRQEDRSAFLDRSCAGDPQLRREVDSLLASVDKSVGFIERPLQQVAQLLTEESEGPGSRIQAYELLKLIGEGGMGKVYLAARADDQYSKQVAIKLLQAGFAQTTAMLLRFRSERQILADLDHPNIARLLDGGATPSGLPFLAMEYVDGIAIHEYCRQNRLSIEERLRLFITVCGAVDYAHKHLVVHRDIKPANILVTKEGAPKLLDFGIAKLVDPEDGTAAETRTVDRLMTPEYASPEQITGSAVTTATDVYALGVVLYELLSGSRPFNLGTMTPMELYRAICERDPEAPSTRAVKADVPRAVAAEKIDGELDNIVMMAMRKEPGQRYRSARDLGDDITAYMNGYPVRAKTATLGYRSTKFIRRNRAAVAVAALAIVALVGFSIRMAVLERRARQQQAIAERESGFLSSIFAASMPIQARGNQVSARDLLDRGLQRVDRELSSEPEAQAAMLQSIGRSYHALGLYDQAKPLLQRAYQLRKNLFGDGDLKTAESAEDLATTDRLQSEYADAEKLFRASLAVREKKLGPNDPLVAQSLSDLGDCLTQENRDSEAEPLLRRALAIFRKTNDPGGADTRGYLALILQRAGNFSEAASLRQEQAEIYRQTQGSDSPDYLMTMHNLAASLIDNGDLLDAEKSERQVIEIRRKVDPGHPDMGYSLNNLGWILLEEGNWEEAEPFLRENLEITAKFGSKSDRIATAQNNWGHYSQEKGDYAGAYASYGEALSKMIELRGPESWQVAKVRSNLGQLKFDERDYAGADVELTSVLALVRKLGGDEHPQVAAALIALAEAKMFEGQSTAAEPLLRQALSIREKRLNPGHPAIMLAQVRLGESLTAQGRAAEAEPLLRQALRSAVGSTFPLVRWQTGEAEGALGECLSTLGREPEADQLLRQSRIDLEHHPRPAFLTAHLRFHQAP
jgi:serine/threonine protein kinase/Tfp pilus assembly protein PilF